MKKLIKTILDFFNPKCIYCNSGNLEYIEGYDKFYCNACKRAMKG